MESRSATVPRRVLDAPSIPMRGSLRLALWCLFAVTAGVGVFEIACRSVGIPVAARGPTPLLHCVLATTLATLHAVHVLGPRRGAALLLTGGAVGFAAEQIGMRTGLLFGGHYVYRDGPVCLAGVPVYILCYWMVFVHVGYSLTNALLFWLGRRKPGTDGGTAPLPALVGVAALDAAVITLIDIVLDPLVTRLGWWRWPGGGSHHGVPMGNFLGWFLVVGIASGAFRTYECFRPLEHADRRAAAHLIPVVGYVLLAAMLVAWAFQYGLGDLAWEGIAAMGLTGAVYAGVFARWAVRTARARRGASPATGIRRTGPGL